MCLLFFFTKTCSVCVSTDYKVGILRVKGEIQFACLSLNGVVILKVAGSYNLKHARFVQRQIKILCMATCNFSVRWLYLCYQI